MHCFRLLVCVAAMWFLPKLHLGDFDRLLRWHSNFNSKYFQKFSSWLARIRTAFDDCFFFSICFGGLLLYIFAAAAMCSFLNKIY